MDTRTPELTNPRPDWLYGTGATRVEKGLVWLAVATALPVVAVTRQRTGVTWEWWHWTIAAVLVADVVGGVVANGLAPAKRLYHATVPPSAGLVERAVRHPVVFAALHVHPFAVAALFPGAGLRWALGWYAVTVAGAAVVRRLPPPLQQPGALGVATVAVLAASAVGGPAGMAWLGPVLVLKLVVAHGVGPGPSAEQRPHPAPGPADQVPEQRHGIADAHEGVGSGPHG